MLSSQNASAVSLLPRYLDNELAYGTAQKRLSLKGRQVKDELVLLKHRAHLASNTEVLKAIVLKINEDILVNPVPQMIQQLKSLVACQS